MLDVFFSSFFVKAVFLCHDFHAYRDGDDDLYGKDSDEIHDDAGDVLYDPCVSLQSLARANGEQ